MWIRKDVQSLANKLSAASGIDDAAVYAWLMQVGKDKGCNPRKIDFTIGAGLIFVTGERDTNYIETYKPTLEKWTEPYDGPDYEELILARQDSYCYD